MVQILLSASYKTNWYSEQLPIGLQGGWQGEGVVNFFWSDPIPLWGFTDAFGFPSVQMPFEMRKNMFGAKDCCQRFILKAGVFQEICNGAFSGPSDQHGEFPQAG